MRVLFTTLIALMLGVTVAAQTSLAQTPAAKAPAAGAPAPAAPAAAPKLDRTPEGADKTEADLIEFLKNPVRRADSTCQIDRARVVGATQTADVYEVGCVDHTGFLLSIVVPQSATSTLELNGCLARLSQPGPKLCTFTTLEQNMAPFKDLASKAQRPCAATDRRFVGESGTSYYLEYACPDKSGFMLETDRKANIKNQIPCVAASRLGGGCTLTEVAEAGASLLSTLSTSAKNAGLDCTVAKSSEFPKRADSPYDATEVTCSNRPDGAVIVKTPSKTVVFNCLRARVEGMKCSLNDEKVAYPAITNELKTAKGVSKNYTSCEVNGGQALGLTASNAFLEVTCADGTPGFVMQYDIGNPAPSDILTCREAGFLGGCRMAPNRSST
jgi:hypothetical protein